MAAGGTTVLLTTHYMDEVEALADRVAVLFNHEVVAHGTPSSIGGRDLGAVTISFRLPDGVTHGVAADVGGACRAMATLRSTPRMRSESCTT